MRWLFLCALLLPTSAFAAARECSDIPVGVGKLILYPICHCETFDYATLSETLSKSGVRITRKQALWKNDKGLAKCGITLAWVNPKDRKARSRCNAKNVGRIVTETLTLAPDIAVNSSPLKCE